MSSSQIIQRKIYRLFYRFNVVAVSQPIKYVPRDKHLNGWVCHLDLATREEAEIAQSLDGNHILGRPVIVARAKVPLKYTASWDNTRPSGHNRSDRDRGSAVGTNFESMQEEVFRKWILGQKDRKVGAQALLP
jgi:hypothetical protein